MTAVVIPWTEYTWRARVEHARNALADAEQNLRDAQQDLARSEGELELAERLDIADDPLPEHYGKRLVDPPQVDPPQVAAERNRHLRNEALAPDSPWERPGG